MSSPPGMFPFRRTFVMPTALNRRRRPTRTMSRHRTTGTPRSRRKNHSDRRPPHRRRHTGPGDPGPRAPSHTFRRFRSKHTTGMCRHSQSGSKHPARKSPRRNPRRQHTSHRVVFFRSYWPCKRCLVCTPRMSRMWTGTWLPLRTRMARKTAWPPVRKSPPRHTGTPASRSIRRRFASRTTRPRRRSGSGPLRYTSRRRHNWTVPGRDTDSADLHPRRPVNKLPSCRKARRTYRRPRTPPGSRHPGRRSPRRTPRPSCKPRPSLSCRTWCRCRRCRARSRRPPCTWRDTVR